MAFCKQKTLRGIFATGRQLGLDIEGLREMTSTGRLSLIREPEASRLLRKLQAQIPTAGKPRKKENRLWRLRLDSGMGREICFYGDNIDWRCLGGFDVWLLKFHGVQSLGWVDSFWKAVAIKNALKRMYNQERKQCCRK